MPQWWEAGCSAVGTISPKSCGQNGKKTLKNRNKDEEGAGEGGLLEKAEGSGLLVQGSREGAPIAAVCRHVKGG